jgi:tetratricopeptide (TPR) repeat protein
MKIIDEHKITELKGYKTELSTLNEIAQGLDEGKKIHEVFGLTDAEVKEWYRFGVSLMEQDRFSDAADVLMLLSLIMPNYMNVWMAFGAASVRMGDWDNALSAYLQVLNLEKENPEVYVRIIQCHAAKGSKDMVDGFVDVMQEMCPKNKENMAWHDLAKEIQKSVG